MIFLFYFDVFLPPIHFKRHCQGNPPLCVISHKMIKKVKPRQSGRHIFLLVFYPLLITKGAIFKHFIDDLRQFPHMRLILVALFACLTTIEQIVQRIKKTPLFL